MLDENELYTISDKLVSVYDDLNTFAITDMSQRIMKMQELGLDKLPGSVRYMAMVSTQCGLHYQAMIRKISMITKIGEVELDTLFKDSAIETIINDDYVYKKHGKSSGVKIWDDMSDSNKQIVSAMYKRTNKEMKNFTRTTADASQTQLHSALDKAYNEVSLGYKSYDEAIADALKEIANTGTKVIYESGYQDSVETSVRRSVLTGINQMAGQVSANNAIDMGAEYMITSSHIGARVSDKSKVANHAGWQGKVFKIVGKDAEHGNLREETGFDYKGVNSDPLGLHGYNCRHSVFPYFLGDENPFKQYDTEENKIVYEENSKLRRYEREKQQAYNAVLAYRTALKDCKDGNLGIELTQRLEVARKIHKNKCDMYNEYKNAVNTRRNGN